MVSKTILRVTGIIFLIIGVFFLVVAFLGIGFFLYEPETLGGLFLLLFFIAYGYWIFIISLMISIPCLVIGLILLILSFFVGKKTNKIVVPLKWQDGHDL